MTRALKVVHPTPTPPEPAEMPAVRVPYPFDAALEQQGPRRYRSGGHLPFAAALVGWLDQIRAEHLADVTQASLHDLVVDHRDGALCRGKGGLAYTPHAWSQLVSLMKVPAPPGLGNVLRWFRPLARHFGWANAVASSKRPKTEEAVLRTFLAPVGDRRVPAVRAVVSGRHSLKDFDDKNVADTLSSLEAKPVTAAVDREWNHTHGMFMLDAGDEDVALGFYMKNSETGGASLSFRASLSIRALDACVGFPEGPKYERMVSVASARASSTRRHTLPRYSARTGERLTEQQRTAIAQDRISQDVETALEGSRILLAGWKKAKLDVDQALLVVCRMADAGDENAAAVLSDWLLERDVSVGQSREELEAFARAMAKVLANDARLSKLPRGSVAHVAAAMAVVASDGGLSWDEALELQRQAGVLLARAAGGVR